MLSPAAKYMLLQLRRPERPVFQGIEPKGVSYRRESWLPTGYERTVRTPLLLTTRPSMLLAVSILATTHAGGGGGSVIAVDMIPDRLEWRKGAFFSSRFLFHVLHNTRRGMAADNARKLRVVSIPSPRTHLLPMGSPYPSRCEFPHTFSAVLTRDRVQGGGNVFLLQLLTHLHHSPAHGTAQTPVNK